MYIYRIYYYHPIADESSYLDVGADSEAEAKQIFENPPYEEMWRSEVEVTYIELNSDYIIIAEQDKRSQMIQTLRLLRDRVGSNGLTLYGDGSGGLNHVWADGQNILQWDNLDGLLAWILGEDSELVTYNHNYEGIERHKPKADV